MNEAIFRDFNRVPADIVRQAAGFQAAILADVNGRRGALDGRIRPVFHSRMTLAGSVLTVEVRPGDNLMIHAAIAIARPGDVLVVDGKGDLTAALMGTIMTTACKQLGLAGALRKAGVLQEGMDFPVFAAGSNPNGPTKTCPGESATRSASAA